MKKLVNVSAIFGIAILVLLLVFGSALAQETDEMEPAGEGEMEAEAEVVEETPSGTNVRIDFELAPGQSAKKGHYSVQELGGREIASWYALDGWLDSGWIETYELSFDSVYVQVLYYPGPDTEPTELRLLNPIPGKDYSWASRGTAHALEVAWPDMPVEGFDETLEE